MLKSFIAAMSLLTIIPMPPRDLGEEDFQASVKFFPLVGLLLGVMTAGVAACTYGLLPAMPGSVLLVLAMAGFSGGLHLDGLADTADALMSSRTRERMLEIMHDSRVGSMGVLGVTGIILAKTTAFGALAAISTHLAIVCAAITPLAGRVSLVIALLLQQPYARGSGLGKAYFADRTLSEAIAAGLLLAVVCLLTFDVRGLAAAVLTCAAVAGFSMYARRKLGGGTGDTVGAACEFAEAVLPLLLLATLHHGWIPA